MGHPFSTCSPVRFLEADPKPFCLIQLAAANRNSTWRWLRSVGGGEKSCRKVGRSAGWIDRTGLKTLELFAVGQRLFSRSASPSFHQESVAVILLLFIVFPS